jgi:hypothetical protein
VKFARILGKSRCVYTIVQQNQINGLAWVEVLHVADGADDLRRRRTDSSDRRERQDPTPEWLNPHEINIFS